MTQVAFSHQFSHRWANAPLQVKGALIQELDDIVQLLDDKTDLEKFEFSIPDLHAYIDGIYAEITAEQEATRQEEHRLEAERLAAEREAIQSTEAEEAMQLQVETQTISEKEDTNADSVEPVQAELSNDVIEDSVEDDSKESTDTAEDASIDAVAHNTTDHTAKTDSTVDLEDSVESESESNSQTDSSVELTPSISNQPEAFQFKNTQGPLDEDFVKELESHIEDYLSEQLANMSEDLKAWVRDQVQAHLNNKQS